MPPDLKEYRQKILNQGNIPRHIAIIMDGNGRWAKKRGLPRVAGHHEGVKAVREIVRICGEIGVEYLTLYTFSAENWKRPKTEVSALMSLLLQTIRKEVSDLKKNNVRLLTIGELKDFPDAPRQAMEEAKRELAGNTGLTLVLALSYSSRREIVQAVNRFIENNTPAPITEEDFTAQLYTAGIPDPELLIRTSGETRISNFLLWQLAYTEIFITPTFWPDFREKELYDAIADYQSRERRFGKVSEQLQENDSSK
ncbi:isoprenyl transferase [bacterium]|nr:isoprenyl transferase [FCB group bacterium]MBL7191012.1 isoprenyl transferase [bacterium]